LIACCEDSSSSFQEIGVHGGHHLALAGSKCQSPQYVIEMQGVR
jgi:hypothetical protein